jgi:hypothetical protein
MSPDFLLTDVFACLAPRIGAIGTPTATPGHAFGTWPTLQRP